MSYWGFFPRKPTVGEQRRQAAKALAKLAKRTGTPPAPVALAGRAIASTFWGKAWCANLDAYRDYENRLPRGRSYLRHGAVLDLVVEPGRVVALVQGSSLYRIEVQIAGLAAARWQALRSRCSRDIGSVLELLQGRLPEAVLRTIAAPKHGLFPALAEITMRCSCPDGARLCKHIAAALYGVGARLDAQPELLFVLRKVDAADLVAEATRAPAVAPGGSRRRTLAADALESVFGIEIEAEAVPGPLANSPPVTPAGKRAPAGRVASRKPVRKKAVARQAAPGRKTPRAGAGKKS